MAQSSNQAFYIEALKAIKQAGEQSPLGSDMRKIYQTKANSLRDTLKKLGYANVDADYGAGVSLANTPGGGKIDWNILANAADILGTSQAGSTRSAFDRALGEYLTRNLPVWQKQQATTPSSALTATATPVMGGSSAAASIASGQPLTASSVNSGMQASQAVATQTAKGAGTWNMGTAGGITPNSMDNVAPGFNPDGTPVQGGGAGGNLYGDFIKSEYFKNNDFDGYFLSVNKGLNLPTITDPTTGRVTIDWKAKDANGKPLVSVSIFNSYGNMTGLWNDLQGLSKEKDSYNAIDIEKNPVFKEQLNVLDAEMASLQKQFNLNVDAQLAGLKGSITANKAGLEYELNTIKREIGASNWRSRQSLAASGMAFSGMLGYLYGQNEAKGMDATIRATAISAAEIKAIGEQMAILDGSKLSYASDLERIYGGKRALARMTILDPQNDRLEEIGKLFDQAISDFETEKGLIAPAAELGARDEAAVVSETERADFIKTIGAYSQDYQKEIDRIQAKVDAGDKSEAWKIPYLNDARNQKIDTTTGQAKEEFVATIGQFDGNYQAEIDRIVAGKDPNEQWKIPWLKLARVDKLAGITKEARADFLNTIGQYADNYQAQIDKIAGDKDPSNDWQIGYLKQAKLDQIAAKAAADAKVNAGGGGGTTQTNGYSPDADYVTLRTSNVPPAALGLSSTRLMAGLGAVNAQSMNEFLNGTTLYWDPTKGTKGEWVYEKPTGVDNPQTSPGTPGFLALTPDKALEVLSLIQDPEMQVMAAVSYEVKDSRSYADAVDAYTSHLTEVDLTNEQKTRLAQWLVATWPPAAQGSNIPKWNPQTFQFETAP